MRWRITIEAWPHSTGKGQENDQAAAGDRVRYFYTDADDMREAYKLAQAYSEGVQSHDMVWRAPITCITQWDKP
jgi:hypothetical protein